MYKKNISTPLGPLTAIGDDLSLYGLAFEDNYNGRFGSARSLDSIEKELALYFTGKLKTFRTPLFLAGTPFQLKVWEALNKIPYGRTCSYLELAQAIGHGKACRAVGSANGANRFPIVIPCHRVINANGRLGGYGCGLERKLWLLDLEKSLIP